MTANSVLNETIYDDLAILGLYPLPDEVIDRQGLPMDLSGDKWKYNVIVTNCSFNWISLGKMHPYVEYALKKYAIYCIKQKSEHESFNQIGLILSLIRHSDTWRYVARCDSAEDIEIGMRLVTGEIVDYLRRTKTIDRFHRFRKFYNYCADNMPELGFDPEYAAELDMIFVGGGPKGEAVRSEDKVRGQLYDTEVTAVRKALINDNSTKREHIMEKCAVALGLAYGRNPANYIMLREEDLFNITSSHDDVPDQWMLRIYSIKKPKQVFKRQLYKDEFVNQEMRPYIQDLIDSNESIDTKGLPRPIFMRETPDPFRVGTPIEEYAYHYNSSYINVLLSRFVKRHHIVSPRTNELLHLTPRRLRYTFACEMVRQGVSRSQLARMLDHSDEQNVHVYFEIRGETIEWLDRAAEHKIDGILGAFYNRRDLNSQKKLDKHTREKIEEVSHLDSPYSCYSCQKLRPYSEADHAAVLRFLNQLPDPGESNEGLGLQFDEVIDAILAVVNAIQVEG